MPKSKILIIDDEPNVCQFIGEFLEFKGYEISSAYSGEKALALLGDNSFDLILLDLIMPGMNGLEVLEEIKRTEKDIPIIIVTGVKDKKVAADALKMGAIDFITKPIDLDVLEESIMLNIQQF